MTHSDRLKPAAELKQTVLHAFDELDSTMEEVALAIHSRPELAFEEHESVRLLTDHLRKAGFQVERPIAGLDTAFIARLAGGAGSGPRLAILVQYDALEGIGHACSHNLIAAGGLGAALALAPVMSELAGELVVIGCPAEEGGGGKVIMANAGVFDNLDAALMFHGWDSTAVLAKYIAVGHMDIQFQGRPAHAGAAPWEGANALEAAMLMFQGINSLRQHIVPTARIHGKITDGGGAPNIIHEHAAATVYVRASDIAEVEKLSARVEACARGAALMTDTKVEITRAPSYKEMLNNRALGAVFHGNLKELNIPIDQYEMVSTASTDMGDVSYAAPTIYPVFRIGDSLPHTHDFLEASASALGLQAMKNAARAISYTVLDLFSEPTLVQQIVAEHTENTRSRLLAMKSASND